ncbi:DUF4755 domain-containing protein [Ralstonia insidiosa]|uniref:DUF4755 domain-containing protein n=1 Tax=Ralstonia insidiosa TaxID=190721 RepID=A0A848NQE9_9RALS|nr:DUF4755 domain-containing protein [Ralstonia insidiosa]NMV37311.1 DUF4755 domain-containing protein [Ralstonia insidiosa]
MRALMKLMWILSGLWAFFIGIAGLLLFFAKSPGAGFLTVLVAAAPLFLVWRWSKSQQASAEKLLREMIGLPEGSGYLFASGVETACGIALNPATRQIALIEAGARKAYSFDDIREWQTIHETAGQVIGGGLQGAVANMSAGAAAAARSGMFIVVRDIDRPKWRIVMPKNEHDRWMEIMRQVVNQQ